MFSAVCGGRTYEAGVDFTTFESPARPLKRDGTVPISIPPFSSPSVTHSQDEIELYPLLSHPPLSLSPAQCISISPKTNGAGNRMGNQRFVSESSREMQREEQAVSFRVEWRVAATMYRRREMSAFPFFSFFSSFSYFQSRIHTAS